MTPLRCPTAILLDLDGVVYIGEDALPGAQTATATLRAAGLPLRFVTNTTTRTRQALLQKLRRLGVEAHQHEVFTPAILARRRIAQADGGPLRLLGAPSLAADLGTDVLSPSDPGRARWVVLALHPPAFHHDALTAALRDIQDGAELIALHANRTWVRPDGLALGLGAYVRALEYAAETTATIIGKPARPFFDEATTSLPEDARAAVWMIGDDIEGDIGGAKAAGLHTALVLSGKTTAQRAARSPTVPDLVATGLLDACQQLLPTLRG